MIGSLTGRIVERLHPGRLVIDVNGVGYDVETSLHTFFQLENQEEVIGLHIHMVVREDALLLYGFLSQEERTLFRLLIKVNGIGPKLAIAILSSITPGEFIQCIHQNNASLLTRLPGIGKKTAERLVMEMKDKLAEVSSGTAFQTHTQTAFSIQEEAIKALEALGYKRQEASKAVRQVDDGQQSCEQLIRHTLQLLSRNCVPL